MQILRFFRRRRICVQAQPDLQHLNLARPHGFQRGLVLLRGDACAERAVHGQIGFGQGGLDEQGVGNDADIRTHAAKLNVEAFSRNRALFGGQRADILAQRRRTRRSVFQRTSCRARTFERFPAQAPSRAYCGCSAARAESALAGIHVVFFMGIEGEDDLRIFRFGLLNACGDSGNDGAGLARCPRAGDEIALLTTTDKKID